MCLVSGVFVLRCQGVKVLRCEGVKGLGLTTFWMVKKVTRERAQKWPKFNME